MTIGKIDIYLDLLFCHRCLRRLAATELKLPPSEILEAKLHGAIGGAKEARGEDLRKKQ